MFSDRLRTAREMKGYTQEELGQLIGETRLQIWRWENGKNYPNSQALARIARTLNVQSDYLLGLTDSFWPDLEESTLSLREQSVIASLRQGDIVEAIRVIVSRE